MFTSGVMLAVKYGEEKVTHTEPYALSLMIWHSHSTQLAWVSDQILHVTCQHVFVVKAGYEAFCRPMRLTKPLIMRLARYLQRVLLLLVITWSDSEVL